MLANASKEVNMSDVPFGHELFVPSSQDDLGALACIYATNSLSNDESGLESGSNDDRVVGMEAGDTVSGTDAIFNLN